MKTQQPTILDETHALDTLLTSIKNTRIEMAVAFASKTELVIETLLEHGNTVSLLIGTINNFTDPSFIHHCRQLSQSDPEKIKIYVDFRADKSIHWKVYLIEPDTVIIGSPNLTVTGLRMSRDTAVVLKDSNLYNNYRTRIASLKRENRESILYVHSLDFMQKFAAYERIHRRESGQTIIPRTSPLIPSKRGTFDFSTWLLHESSQILPLFIWDQEMTEEEITMFEEEVIPVISDNENIIGDLYVIGMYDGSNDKQEYYENDLVLTMNYAGHHINFVKISIVIFTKGKWWLCGLSSQTVPEPFALTKEIKSFLKKKRIEWYSAGKTYLTSKDLRDMAKSLS